jgi:hypothetical protein
MLVVPMISSIALFSGEKVTESESTRKFFTYTVISKDPKAVSKDPKVVSKDPKYSR